MAAEFVECGFVENDATQGEQLGSRAVIGTYDDDEVPAHGHDNVRAVRLDDSHDENPRTAGVFRRGRCRQNGIRTSGLQCDSMHAEWSTSRATVWCTHAQTARPPVHR